MDDKEQSGSECSGATQDGSNTSALKRAAEEWRWLFDSLADPVCVLDNDGRITRCNKALSGFLGRTFPETLGHRLFDLARGEATEDLMSTQFDKALDSGAAQTGAHMILGRWFDVRFQPEAASGGCICTLRDINDKRRADDALRRNLAFQEAVLESTPSLTMVADEAGFLTYVNSASRRVCEFDLSQLLGKQIVPLLLSADSWERLRARASGRGSYEDESLDTPIRTSSGGERVISWRTSTIHGQEPGKRYIVLSGADMTARRKIEEHLSQSEKLSALGELIAGVAHELNNPLTGVIGFAELVGMADGLTPQIADDIKTIQKSARRCKAIVNNLLRFARQRKPEISSIDMRTVIEDSIQLFEYQLRVANIDVEEDLCPGMPRVLGDFDQLAQVIVNLINNAQQAMHAASGKGRLRISTRVLDSKLRIRIEDDGPGIPDEDLSKVFDPFFTTKPVGEGTGLGLSVCFGIIATHRGRIIAARSDFGGAQFTIELPVATEQPTADEPAEPAQQVLRLKQNVLIVDDEAMVLDVLTRMLGALGFIVQPASSAKIALEMLGSSRFDLVISDFKMPGMGGPELYEEAIKRRPDLEGRFMFCTGDTVSRDTRSFLDGIQCSVVSKPFNMDELASTLADMQRRIAAM